MTTVAMVTGFTDSGLHEMLRRKRSADLTAILQAAIGRRDLQTARIIAGILRGRNASPEKRNPTKDVGFQKAETSESTFVNAEG